MIVVGLTGKACSGKNVIADMLVKEGWRVVDVDKLGHPILQQSAGELTSAFGPSVISSDGTVDRKVLGGIVFSDAAKLRKLEDITHPRMVKECGEIVDEEAARGGKVVVLNAALLSRMHLDRLCSMVVFVKVPWNIRYHRAQSRDGMDWRRFRARESAQKDIDVGMIEPGREVIVLDNSGTLESVHRQVVSLCDKINQAIRKDWQV